ncbi:MAG: recombinase family protein [Clostridiales bacterium]|nr:recombinase family protein [Clostridiales bacterium]
MARKKRLDVNRILDRDTHAAPAQRTEATYQVGAYIRLSVEDSGKINGYSLENQEKLLLDYIASQQDMELYKLYSDNGFSGTKFDRPAFDEMMQDMREGKINCIVVKDLSRLGRNYLEAGNYLEQIFPFFRVRLISINDGYDSISPDVTDESLIIPLKNIINEGYAKDISIKVSSALAARKRQGKFTGKYPPYGYLKDPADKNHLIVDEETSPIVRRIFRMRDSGMALGAIARRLNEEGIPAPMRYLYLKGISQEERYRDVYWDRTKIKRLLSNQVYLGILVYGKSEVSFAKGIASHTVPPQDWKKVYGTHEAIIEQELFDSVQVKLKESKQAFFDMTGINEDYQPENLFRGRIHCSDCGGAMKMTKFVRKKSDGTVRRYAAYECCRRKDIYDYSCPSRSIRKAALDKAVEEAIRFHIQAFLDAEAVIQKLNRTPAGRVKSSDVRGQIRERQRRIAKVERLSTGIYEDYREGVLNETEYLSIRKSYAEEREWLQQEVDMLMEQESQYSETFQCQGTLSERIRRYQEFEVLSSEIVEAFIADIRVHTDSHLEIIFNFEDEFQKLIKASEQRKEELT